VVFGYLCRTIDIHRVVQDQVDQLLRSRRLPLVLDLDDTLVRVVADDNPDKYVPKVLSETGIKNIEH
jgi:predicted HAD superfamily phosphohydrolase YqeG